MADDSNPGLDSEERTLITCELATRCAIECVDVGFLCA